MNEVIIIELIKEVLKSVGVLGFGIRKVRKSLSRVYNLKPKGIFSHTYRNCLEGTCMLGEVKSEVFLMFLVALTPWGFRILFQDNFPEQK